MRHQVVFSLCLPGILAAMAALAWSGQPLSPPAAREIAITIDDLPVASRIDQSIEHHRRVTSQLLEALGRHNIAAVGFVNEGKLERDGVLDPDHLGLLQQWIDAGLELANHTFSHIDLNTASVDAYQADVQRGEVATSRLLGSVGQRLRYFRHPYLHTGRDAATRKAVDEFLAGRGYRIAPVTVDAWDWMFAFAMDQAVSRNDSAMTEQLIASYLAYTDACLTYSEQRADHLFRRPIRHVLLLHANALNARAFDALAALLARRGYSFVPLDRALADSAYESTDAYLGENGIGWLERWSLSTGDTQSALPRKPEVPAWVVREARMGS